MYVANENRYEKMAYRRTGKSGLKLPEISLGLWHNFGAIDNEENCRSIVKLAFDKGLSHFDLANNYGPPAGTAEEMFGRILKKDLLPYRDEIIISSKAGFDMWPGPYGDFGSRKYLIASCEQSLKRMGIDYVDIFYHHRPDPDTPIEETMGALSDLVRQGKALYVGISNYGAEEAKKAIEVLKNNGTPCLIHQANYSMLNRWTEEALLDVLESQGVGCICFSPLAQGLLTNRYLDGTIPEGSRASQNRFLKPESINEKLLQKLNALNKIALENNTSLARMAIRWILRDKRNTSVLLGASSPEQMSENLRALEDRALSDETLAAIEAILNEN